MAAATVPLPRVKATPINNANSIDQSYWSSFSNPSLLPTLNSSPVTYISSNGLASITRSATGSGTSTYIAVTTGSRLQLLSPQTLKPVRTITRTASAFHGANVRSDGRILISGTDSGAMLAFDISSRAILKTWDQDHKQPVWVSKWHPLELTTAMSCSDDGTVRLWDLPSDKSIWTAYGHSDYVRCGSFLGGSSRLIVSGSYDRSIRIWDPRAGGGERGANAAVMHFKLGAPVEAVMALPGGTTVVGAAGEKMAVIDIVAGKPLHLLQNHQKTITSLASASRGTRVLSGGLDGHVKVFDSNSWQVVAGFKYPSPVLTVDVVPSNSDAQDRHLCIGMQSGIVSIRTRLTAAARAAKREKEAEMAALAAGTIEAYDRKQAKKLKQKGGASANKQAPKASSAIANLADITIETRLKDGQRKRLVPWETAFRRANYPHSLDLALESRDPTQIFTLITALIHSSALRTAVQHRSAATLLPLLKFVNKTILDPRYSRLTTDLALIILDCYAEHLGQSVEIDGQVRTLHELVRRATEVSQTCCSTLGMLSLLGVDSAVVT